MKLLIAIVFAMTISPAVAHALPQLAVMSGRACDNCHLDPLGWENPEVSERKCSLSCTSCHVNPTGGGMRSAGGRFYGREILPMFGIRPGDSVPDTVPPSHAASQPAVGVQMPVGLPTPAAGTPERYAGFDPRPWFQAGADLRVMAYFPEAKGTSNAVFPMQTDLYLAGSPYNPEGHNHGRLTLLVNAGALGSRAEEFDGFTDRFFLREWWALFDDLPYQAYAKAGQFLPAYGWRLDDHTAFIRQGQSFNNERQVTGIEVGIAPNYPYAHASLYVPGPLANRDLGASRNRLAIIDFDQGVGTALSAGYRDLWWQAGGSFMFESRENRSDLWIGANWALNLHEARHPWKKLEYAPVVYFGELDFRMQAPNGERTKNGLTAFHEVDFLVIDGLFLQLRYDWQDPDIQLKDDHRHRYTVGLVAHPYTFVEVFAQVRFNDEPAKTMDNELLIQIHAWF